MSYIVLKNMEKAFKELDKIDEWRLKKMDKNNSVKTIEQQDFLKEYLKDKPGFTYERVDDYLFNATNDFIMLQVFDEDENYYCTINSLELENLPPFATFMFPQTYEKFKTIMDIFLGVENANP